MKTALFPGTFRPFTTGHKSIVDRGLTIFDRIVIAVGYNEHKSSVGTVDETVNAIREIYKDNPNVSVESYSGLTVDFAKEAGADCILRGVRNIIDFEYEKSLSDVNRKLSGIETVLLYTLPELGYVSGSMVRELEHNGVDISEYLAK
ncbi:MAG: pantetheine-phosphate adenylyltransferase [Prevotella sp.]|nr:pantetheine-phosphate adenylyltransferase [Bacteroides sp.]MCM1366610.1 pantetheine-phosphate adenylyltransferase [Prevotella sp.]MCM1437293.1 pantetheine-phosphate adenylyltransferase [Prevotella sp.]